jgi:hypothetical protein
MRAGGTKRMDPNLGLLALDFGLRRLGVIMVLHLVVGA